MKDRATISIHNIFKINLGVKKKERVLVLSDNYNNRIRKISRDVVTSGKNSTSNIRHTVYEPTGCHGVEPPEYIWREAFGNNIYRELIGKNLFRPILEKKLRKDQLKAIEKIIKKYRDDAVDVIIALSYFSTSHTRFRDFLNRICGTRYASMPLFDEAMLTGAMRVNWGKMLKRTRAIAQRMKKCEDIEIAAPNGTHILLSKKNREVNMDTGIITKSGGFSNLPAGEVFLAPCEGTAYGSLVLEWAPTRKLKNPVTLRIEKGLVTEVKGKDRYVGYLKEKLSERRENRNIAELGIGTNDAATRPDNILESEKIFGTIHIALGDNSSFGGSVRTSFHQDFVFFKPTVTLVSKNKKKDVLMIDGKLTVSGIW